MSRHDRVIRTPLPRIARILTEAALRIRGKPKCVGFCARDSQGGPCDAFSERAVRWDIIGAIHVSSEDLVEGGDAIAWLMRSEKIADVVGWHEDPRRMASEVATVLERAAACAAEGGKAR